MSFVEQKDAPQDDAPPLQLTLRLAAATNPPPPEVYKPQLHAAPSSTAPRLQSPSSTPRSFRRSLSIVRSPNGRLSEWRFPRISSMWSPRWVEPGRITLPASALICLKVNRVHLTPHPAPPYMSYCSLLISNLLLLTTHHLYTTYYSPTHYSLLTTHYSLLTTHYSLLTTHYLLLTTHYSLLTTHYSLLTTYYPLLTTHYSLLTTHSLLLTTVYSLLTTYSILLTTHYSLLTTHYSLLATHYPLLTTHYSLLTTHCSLLTTHYSLLTTHLRTAASVSSRPPASRPLRSSHMGL